MCDVVTNQKQQTPQGQVHWIEKSHCRHQQQLYVVVVILILILVVVFVDCFFIVCIRILELL